MSQILIGWLMKIEGFEETHLTTGFYDDRWYRYTSSRPLDFYQKDMIEWKYAEFIGHMGLFMGLNMA